MSTKRMWGMFPKAQNDNYQITDLLQLSRKEKESKIQCLRIMRRRNEWRKMHGSHAHFKWMVYAKVEGMLLKRQVQDAILFYRLVKTERIRAFDTYLSRLPSRSFVKAGAQ